MLQSQKRFSQLDRKVTFIEKVITDGDSNEDYTNGWQEAATNPTVSAGKEDLAGYEALIGDRITYVQPVKWTVRYEDGRDKTVRMRLVYEKKVFEIQAIVEPKEGRRRYLEVMTKLIDTEFFT
ncbi:MAG TPA: head-tail adaptor protein [Cyclobacteriaceae bacterium]|nr:head-tail adaptor protein [Cyclobacteriaceae bacterium]